MVRDFIETSNGKFILDRDFMERIIDFDEDEIMDNLEKYAQGDLKKKTPKNNTVYDIEKFERKDEFLNHIANDILIFEEIKSILEDLKIVQNDPKRREITREIKAIIAKEPNRKVILFSEYVDTILHLEEHFRNEFGNRLLVCAGKVSKELAKNLNTDFNAQFKKTQTNNFDVIITSDKLSEGFNLNRAGVIINYDIPWNPTRVIQRVGRINRIGVKVFDELYIYNYFPSEVGADIVKSREIAQQKMFLIHSALGEDAKIFDIEEEPSAAGLYSKLNQSPDEDGEVNTVTVVRNTFKDIQTNHPEVIEKINNLPPRVKTAKQFEKSNLNVLRKKGLSLFAQVVDLSSDSKFEIEEVIFEELLEHVKCVFEEPRLTLSNQFWPTYEKIKNFKPTYKTGRSDISLESKALENLSVYIKLINGKEEALAEFVKTLRRDLKKYHTLSTRSIGRLGRKQIDKSSNEKDLKAFTDDVIWLRNHLGENYLDNILERVDKYQNEVIIAVENINI
jgi:superfamily II DNA/RNA helicase